MRKNKHHSIYLQRAWVKYGEDAFVFDIIESCFSFILIYREQFWIDHFKPEYNIAQKAGSALGVKHTLETRNKVSLAGIGRKLTEETRKKISLGKMGNTWNKGRTPSNINILREANRRPKTEQAKLNMSKARLGKRTKKRLIKDDMIVEMYKLYNEGKAFDEIVELLKIKRSTLSNVFYSKSYYKDVKEKYNLKLNRPKLQGDKYNNYKTKQ